jgi:hypothetical protein
MFLPAAVPAVPTVIAATMPAVIAATVTVAVMIPATAVIIAAMAIARTIPYAPAKAEHEGKHRRKGKERFFHDVYMVR